MKRPIDYTAALALLFLGALMLGLAWPVSAQEDEGPKPERTRHRLSVYQLVDSVRYLQATVYVSAKGERTDVAGAEIAFYLLTDTSEVLLTTATTGNDGIAIAVLPPMESLSADTGGYYAFLSRFDGSDLFRGSEADIRFRDLSLTTETEEGDSVNTLLARLTDPMTGEGVEGVDVNFYVQRMFRPLRIGQEQTDRRGGARVDFPPDLPAGPDGKVHLTVRIEDSDEFGNVEAVTALNWGVPVAVADHGKKLRTLWSPNAPLWMLITFIILMGTVWGHYVAIAVLLRRIGKLRDSGSKALIWEQ